ncbi:MAG: DUF2309 domain-containing protein [Cyclobacteriaceae bacterium]|nr:DUF2309 domain-containing protein [Cyclobacteriaceae bacterium]
MTTDIDIEISEVIHKLKHYLPSQSPLKDFVHHNTLHAFQNQKFEHGIRNASKIFGFKVSFNVDEYRELYHKGKIQKSIIERVLTDIKGKEVVDDWLFKLIYQDYDSSISKRVGLLRSSWKTTYSLDLDTIVHSNLFRILNSYLDQGVGISKFPNTTDSFLDAIRDLDSISMVSFFKTKRTKSLLNDRNNTLTDLLKIVVGDERFYEQYLFDQQFAHPGWSGLVGVIEENPHTLLDQRKITLHDFIYLECLFEIDNLDNSIGEGKWLPIASLNESAPKNIIVDYPLTELDEVLNLWQEAYEWTYYDEVLAAIMLQNHDDNYKETSTPSFQAFFCIDDRECSIRRYIETTDKKCKTYGTPGHFGIDSFYQPENGKYYTKVCPGPINPQFLIREVATQRKQKKDIHYSKYTHRLFLGWLITQSLGFWSAIKLMLNIFRPSLSPASSSSFRHMNKYSLLTVENRSSKHVIDGLQIGYTIPEMTDRVEQVLKSTGCTQNFAPLIYIIGHGASSANNTHYAGYDCGACSGRPGSVNARAFSYMANHNVVREQLSKRGINIPAETEFLGGLHDTTRDEFVFFDEELLSPSNARLNRINKLMFAKCLDMNAKERSRRFMSIKTTGSSRRIHESVKSRSVSLFEPRPELNHATNTLCVIGKNLNKNLFLDRRAFLNSYDYQFDPEGKFLAGILNAAAPVCGGINLEYFFSRVDNEKLGAGSKLPHNVMGLIGVANGFEGDLRPGLPIQMVEVHDPIRLLMIVEHFPEVVLTIIKSSSALYEWFDNNWVKLVIKHPKKKEIYVFKEGDFSKYYPMNHKIESVSDLSHFIESTDENLPVLQLN